MAHLAPNYEERQEFWKPAVAPRQEAAVAENADQVCQECGTDFVLGSRFLLCLRCGQACQSCRKFGVRIASLGRFCLTA